MCLYAFTFLGLSFLRKWLKWTTIKLKFSYLDQLFEMKIFSFEGGGEGWVH